MPCSQKLKDCVKDVMAQGKPKNSAWPICKASIKKTVKKKLKLTEANSCHDKQGKFCTGDSITIPNQLKVTVLSKRDDAGNYRVAVSDKKSMKVEKWPESKLIAHKKRAGK